MVRVTLELGEVERRVVVKTLPRSPVEEPIEGVVVELATLTLLVLGEDLGLVGASTLSKRRRTVMARMTRWYSGGR